jgi:exopolysaccharide biosynthesis polyprenyl glycosylphosphotransferase
MKDLHGASNGGWGRLPESAARRRWTEHTVLRAALLVGLLGDGLCVAGVLHGAVVLSHGAADDPLLHSVAAWLYAGLGTAIFIGAFAYNGIYRREFLLDRRKQSVVRFEAWLGSCLLFFGATSMFGTALVTFPCAMLAAFALLLLLSAWRVLLQNAMRSGAITRLLSQRVIILGWSDGAGKLARQTWEDLVYPCEIVGYVEVALERPNAGLPPTVPCLGTKDDLAGILEHHQIDAAFLAETDIPTDDVLDLARTCQTEMVEFKVVPACFPALVSGMHVEWVSGVPILGTDRLRMNQLHVRMEKRAFDILGALVGLLLAGPLIGLFGLMVYLESPGPVLYRQRRLGRKGKPFEMIKIRSMRVDAEKDGQAGWTVSGDPRRLKIGAVMRRWNIDELPQFWNVLKGDMSLVGPRPERPEFVHGLKHDILHYNLRHSVKPGLTGWAQVNGLRGDTDLSERIRHDLFYIDNWSVLLDVQTMFLTLFKHKNAC